jgi:hypothetical protein
MWRPILLACPLLPAHFDNSDQHRPRNVISLINERMLGPCDIYMSDSDDDEAVDFDMPPNRIFRGFI